MVSWCVLRCLGGTLRSSSAGGIRRGPNIARRIVKMMMTPGVAGVDTWICGARGRGHPTENIWESPRLSQME